MQSTVGFLLNLFIFIHTEKCRFKYVHSLSCQFIPCDKIINVDQLSIYPSVSSELLNQQIFSFNQTFELK